MSAITLAVVARVPPAGIADFQAYEDAVLPLLGEHGGRLERRLRNEAATLEVHIVRFSSAAGFEAYRGDPRRQAAAAILERSGAAIEATPVTDVD